MQTPKMKRAYEYAKSKGVRNDIGFVQIRKQQTSFHDLLQMQADWMRYIHHLPLDRDIDNLLSAIDKMEERHNSASRA